MLWLLEHTARFPRHERFRLARRIDDTMFAFHEHLIRAAGEPEAARAHLSQADVELIKLRAYLRLALELKYTSPSQFGYAAQQTAELGRLLGGWLKTARP